MGSWIPDMWERKVAHFTEDAHPVPTSYLELEGHIRDHHPEIKGLSQANAAALDSFYSPESHKRDINIHLNIHHPNGVKAGDHPHTHGEDLDVAIPDNIEAIAPTYIHSSVSRKKYASEIRPSQMMNADVPQDEFFRSPHTQSPLAPESIRGEHGNPVPTGQMGHGVTWDTPGVWRGVPEHHIEEARALGIRPDQYLSALRDYGMDHENIIGPKNRTLIDSTRAQLPVDQSRRIFE